MKKYLSILLVLSFVLTSCGKAVEVSKPNADNITPSNTTLETSENISADTNETSLSIEETTVSIEETTTLSLEELEELVNQEYEEPEFYDYSDPNLYAYIVDNLHSGMEAKFLDEDFIVESISATYIPQEYIDELYNNSQSNIYFGFTEEDLNNIMGGKKFVFTLDKEKGTIVEEQQLFDNDVYRRMLTNVAIGSGVILVCVVVTIVTDGSDIPAVAAICAISGGAAEYGTIGALSGGALGALISGAYKYYKTGDMDEALLAAGTNGSESFKWGAILGAVEGGFLGGLDFMAANANSSIPTWKESEDFVTYLYGGDAQTSYLNGEIVPYGTSGATRPDVIWTLEDGTKEAIEVKNYNLANPDNVNYMITTLKNEIGDRVVNLPEGFTQKIVLDARGRGFSSEIIEYAKGRIWEGLADIYPNIPIEVLV